jgi:hypothetical protein
MKNTLLAFLLFCSCALLAQNVQTTPGAAGGGGSGTINAGATNIIPKYTASTTLDDSLLSDDGTSLTYNATGGGKWCPSGATSGIFCCRFPRRSLRTTGLCQGLTAWVASSLTAPASLD